MDHCQLHFVLPVEKTEKVGDFLVLKRGEGVVCFLCMEVRDKLVDLARKGVLGV